MSRKFDRAYDASSATSAWAKSSVGPSNYKARANGAYSNHSASSSVSSAFSPATDSPNEELESDDFDYETSFADAASILAGASTASLQALNLPSAASQYHYGAASSHSGDSRDRSPSSGSREKPRSASPFPVQGWNAASDTPDSAVPAVPPLGNRKTSGSSSIAASEDHHNIQSTPAMSSESLIHYVQSLKTNANPASLTSPRPLLRAHSDTAAIPASGPTRDMLHRTALAHQRHARNMSTDSNLSNHSADADDISPNSSSLALQNYGSSSTIPTLNSIASATNLSAPNTQPLLTPRRRSSSAGPNATGLETVDLSHKRVADLPLGVVQLLAGTVERRAFIRCFSDLCTDACEKSRSATTTCSTSPPSLLSSGLLFAILTFG